MSRKLFRPGGPLNIRSVGSDQYRATITLPKDSDGRLARECPSSLCSPGYFKVKLGTGITGDQLVAYCPYCRNEAEPDGFNTNEQLRYAKDLVMREARKGVDDMLRNTLGLGSSGRRKIGGGFVSMEISLKSSPLPYVHPPFEDDVRRDVICPHCTLDQTVFGLATWCADCGADIFLTHAEAELNVVHSMVGDIERRREELGRRVAAKDLENCLEDAVSIFEAAMKAMTRRRLLVMGLTSDEMETRFRKIGNAYQNITRTQAIMAEVLGIDALPEVLWNELNVAFEKRHPITHNLGVVDRKYLEHAQSGDHHGREVRITVSEVGSLLDQVLVALSAVHQRLFDVVHDE